MRAHSDRRVHIVGGGFSGLTLAYFLTEKKIPVTISEKEHWGGVIHTIEHRGALIELAANGYLASKRFEEVNQKIQAPIRGVTGPQKRFIVKGGKPRSFPLGFCDLVPLLKFVIQFLLFRASLVPRPSESIRQWSERCLSLGLFRKLIEPALRGIYAGDGERLSAGLIVGKFFRPTQRPERPTQKGLHTGCKGMESWLLHLKKYLEHNGVVFREEEVTDLKSSLKDSSLVVLATPPRAAAQLLRTLNDPRAALLEKIEMLPVASVTLLTEKSAPLQGFGCLFPATENFHSLGVLFRQSFFPEDGAPPQERWILRGDSLNGDIGPKHIQQISESDILARVESDRHRLWGANAPQVTAQHIKLWDEAMPHYTTDLESQLVTLSGDAFTGSGPVFLHGNYLGALGLTALLERSFTLSEEIAKEC